jgi:hypothetical protein
MGISSKESSKMVMTGTGKNGNVRTRGEKTGRAEAERKRWKTDWFLLLDAQEPAPSICLKPTPFEVTGKLVGRWQRPTASGDTIVIEMCPNGNGRWQTAWAGTGGRLQGDILLKGYAFFGKRTFFTPNITDMTDGDIEMKDEEKGGQIFVQTGARYMRARRG